MIVKYVEKCGGEVKCSDEATVLVANKKNVATTETRIGYTCDPLYK